MRCMMICRLQRWSTIQPWTAAAAMSYETRHSAGYGGGRGSAHPATHMSRVQRGSTPHITGLCLISTAGRGKVEQQAIRCCIWNHRGSTHIGRWRLGCITNQSSTDLLVVHRRAYVGRHGAVHHMPFAERRRSMSADKPANRIGCARKCRWQCCCQGCGSGAAACAARGYAAAAG